MNAVAGPEGASDSAATTASTSGTFEYTMDAIGDGWQMNNFSVAQEHLPTATAQTQVVQFFAAQEPASCPSPCARRGAAVLRATLAAQTPSSLSAARLAIVSTGLHRP